MISLINKPSWIVDVIKILNPYQFYVLNTLLIRRKMSIDINKLSARIIEAYTINIESLLKKFYSVTQ